MFHYKCYFCEVIILQFLIIKLVFMQSHKFLIWFFLLIFSCQLKAQNNPDYFKVMPKITEANPQWQQLMYSDNPNVEEVINLYDAYYATHRFVKNIHTQNYKFWLRNISELVDGNGFIQNPYSAEYQNKINKLRQQKLASNAAKTGATWTVAGPFETYKNNGSLENRATQQNVYSLAVAPSNHNILYCFGETGGVFKSVDKGLNWQAVSLNESFINGQDIKVHPFNPNIVYVATNHEIYKTTDGGQNWSLSYTASGKVEQFYIHRTHPDTVYAATASGLFKTTNGGQAWTNIYNKRCWDIEAHAYDPNTIFLSIHNASLHKAEIYKSTNGGDSWVLKDSSWYVPTNFSQATDIGCKIGVTPADTARVYACLIGDSKTGDHGWIGVYYSMNGGDSWVNPDSIDGGPYVSGNDKLTNWYVAGYSSGYHQGWYNFDLDVSSINPDKIWIGTIWVLESDNRGKNIEYIRGTRNLDMHADVQDIEVVGNDIWFASDGGINYSNNEMQTVSVRNNGFYSSDFWGFGQGWNEDTWTGGRYHNGDAVYHENYGMGNTVFQGGAESATGYINPLNNRKCYYSDITDRYTSDSLNMIVKTTSNISVYPNQSYSILNSSEIEFDPRYSDYLFLGKDNKFYKSTDGGATFSVLYSFGISARVLEFEISQTYPDSIYCLVRESNSGKIYLSTNGGNSFSAVAILPSSNRSRLDITLNPSNSKNLWVSTFYGVNGQKVYETTDGGTNWTNRTTSVLNSNRILDIKYQSGSDDVVYIATETGLFYWDKAQSNWISYSDGLPFRTGALKMIPFYRDGKIRLATSRGIWEAPLATPSLPIAQPMVKSKEILCNRDTVQFEDHSVLNHSGASWQWSFTPTPAWVNSLTVRNPRVLFANNGNYSVTLTIIDSAQNTSTKSVQNMVVMNNQCLPDSLPGLALKLENSGDFAAIPDLGINQTNHFTITAWIKLDGIQPEYSSIVMNDDNGAGFNFKSGNEMGYHWPGGQWWWNSGLVVDTNVWSYVAMVVTPDSMTLYLNGISSTHNISLNPNDIGSMKIGSYHGWSSRNMKGEIDEVTIWNRALSQNEIRELRHITRTTALTSDMVAYYQFNLSGTTTVNDRIGNHHASLVGGALKTLSTAPVGGGTSNRQIVGSNTHYVFGNTGVEIDFGSSTPMGEVVVSHLHSKPNISPATTANDGEYWIINNYGTASFSPIDSIKFGYFNVFPLGTASDVKLYGRPENSSLNSWSQFCKAQGIYSNYFLFGANCNITSFSQFYIPFNSNIGFEKPKENQGLIIYPNPNTGRFVVEKQSVVQEDMLIELLDVSSRLLMRKRFLAGEKSLHFDVSDLSKGVYYLKIIKEDKSWVEKIIKD